MNTEQIENVLKFSLRCGSRGKFLGVHPIDRVGEINLVQPGRLCVCILNTDTSSGPGQHWFLLAIRNDVAYMFDSLAKCGEYRSVWQFLRRDTKISQVLYNRQPVQDEQVDSCALHVIYFATMLLKRGFSFEATMQTYNVQTLLLNDCSLLENFSEFLNCATEVDLLREIAQQLPQTEHACIANQS
jgi:hypothetical protein